ncbi:MAG: 3-deoxy-D-manno-octulosonic acid transferase [Candidatus Puniceispirillales bacterium]
MIYRLLTTLIRPFLPAYLVWRSWRGKEEPSRLPERYGRATQKRPPGRVIWLHAASVGETVSALVLAASLLKQDEGATVLITSGTVTSAAMVAERTGDSGLGDRIIHQYVPLDITPWVNRFLDHWQPDLAVMIEGDLWPGLIVETHRRGIPMAMASAQISEKSLRFWQTRGKVLARQIFGAMKVIFAVDADQAERFRQLPVAASAVVVGGSMKAAAMPLAKRPEITRHLEKAANGRTVVLLASSHEGEEALFIDAVESLVPAQTLSVIAPRHPQRARAIMGLLEEKGLTCRQRAAEGWPAPEDRFWLADRMGEMGGLIRAADIIVLGGGFAPLGGHNPMEMAALGKGVISGVNVFKNTSSFDLLKARDGVIFCEDSTSLAENLTLLMASPTRLERHNNGAFNAWKSLAHDTDSVAARLADLMGGQG